MADDGFGAALDGGGDAPREEIEKVEGEKLGSGEVIEQVFADTTKVRPHQNWSNSKRLLEVDS